MTIACLNIFVISAYAADIVIGDTPDEVFTMNAGVTYDHEGDIFVIADGLLQVNGVLNLTGFFYFNKKLDAMQL